ncbi:hypothetical protein LRP88_14551 [Fusarium phalaenopsidis]
MESKTPESPHVQHIDPPGDKPGSMEASNEITLPADIEGPWPSYLAKRWRMILRMSIIYIAVLSVGFDNSVTNTTLGMPAFRRYFGHQTEAGDYVIPAKYVSAWAGGTFGGQVLTDLVGGYLADRIGRKWTLCLSVIVIIIASTIQITAHSIGQIIAGKTVFGMGVGLYISFVTSYTAELAPTRVRGMACMAVNFCIQTGNWIGSGAALGLFNRYPNVNDTRSFRIIFSLQYLFASLFLLTVWWLPESPSFHIHRDDVDKAEKVIAQLYDPDYDSKRHVAFLVQEHEAEKASLGVGKSIGWGELFKGRNPLRMMISACIVWPLLMGTAFWPSYQSYYFELAGATNAQAMNYGCTSVAIGTSIIAYMLIENVGRRRLWLFGATGMACSNLIGGFMYIPVVNGNARVAGKVATAMVFLWNGFYDIGPANMGYAITSEVPSSRMRVKNNAFVHVGSHLTGFALSYAVPYMYNPDAGNLGLRMGFIWGGFSVIFVIWGFFIPDVTGLNFYQIDQLFESRAPVRKFHQAKFDDNGLLIRSFSTRTSGEVS